MCAFWYVVRTEGGVFDGHAAHSPCGWVEAHGFGKDLFGVSEIWVVGEGGESLFRACAKDCVEFGVEFGFYFGVLGEEVPGPGKGVGYCLVSGQEDGEDFVADLGVGHALGQLACGGFGFSGLVGAGEKHGEEVRAGISFLAVLAVGGCCAMFSDETVDN